VIVNEAKRMWSLNYKKTEIKIMKNIVILLCCMVSHNFFSQEDFFYEKYNSSCCLDSLITMDKQFLWENGKIKKEYFFIKDSIRLKKEYYESGNLKYECEIYQFYINDTFFSEDPNVPGQFIHSVKKGYIDIFHGKYFEYADGSYKIIKQTGLYKNGLKKGEWKLYKGASTYDIINYEKGELNGPFYSYKNGILICNGEYKKVIYFSTDINEFTLKPYGQSKKTEIIKCGSWYHYNEAGELLQIITYDWKKQ